MDKTTWNQGSKSLIEKLEHRYGVLREGDYALVADVNDDGVCVGIEGFHVSPQGTYLVSDTNPRNKVPLDQITRIRIPDGAKSIAAEAFRDFCYLKEVIIPDSVSLINDRAFRGCRHLDEINVCKGCTIIGESDYPFKVNRHGDSLLLEKGPAGGIVCYDKGTYSDGWRYLEAAPEDIAVGTDTEFAFGFYRTSSSGTNWYVNGSTTYVEGTSSSTDGKCTGTAIGTGKANTEKLVEKMGSAAYSDWSGTDTTANYAAKLCDDYTYGGYSDWFLPSKDELKLMYTNLKVNGLGGFIPDNYWSSSENYYNANFAWYQYFYYGYQGRYNRYLNLRVRAVRAF